MRLGRELARCLVVAALFVAPGCATNPPVTDGDGGTDGMDGSSSHRDGGGGPTTGPCGTAGGACCAGRICELGLRCGSGDVCCIQPGGGARCDSASDCCRGLACQGGACCAPRTAACTGSADCCTGLACVDGACVLPEEDLELPPGEEDCGIAGRTCCPGFTCRSGLVCNEGTCTVCGDEGQDCCDGASPCVGSLACELTTGGGTVTGTECINPSDPAHSCGDIDQPCCAGLDGAPTDCSGGLVCRGGNCLRPDDTGFDGAPCGPRDSCEPGLVCDRRTDPEGLCGMPPEDCGRDGQMCCDLGGSEQTCSGSLHCQFGDCSTCRGPSLTCLLGGLLPGQECCAGSVCRPAPLIPRCCMGEGGSCENSLDCCGLMSCGGDGTCSCSRENSFCLDSSECCEGLTCQTFMCRPAGPACTDLGASCETSTQCCDGLTCSETRTEPSAPAVRQCCAAAETGCDTNEDCCGQMLCEEGECQCVPRAGLCDRDVECCDGDICLVGSCQDGTDCKRERQVCDPLEDTCCGMLRCMPHYREDVDYCCVAQGERCRESEDCCGNMMCNTETERCEPVADGVECDTQFDCADGFTCAESSPGAGDWRCVRPPT